MEINSTNQSYTAPTLDTSKNGLYILLGLALLLFFIGIGVYIFIMRSTKKLSQSQSIISSTPIVSQPKLSSNVDIQNSILVYQNSSGYGVNLLQGLNTSPVVLDTDGESPSYSQVLQKIAYVDTGMKKDNAVYVYDIPTRQTEERKETVSNGILNRVQWSPDGKYFATVNSTSTLGVITVYSYPLGNKITSFQATVGSGSPFYWSKDMNLIFSDAQPVPTPREAETGMGSAIAKASLINGTKHVLVQADNNYDYSLIDVFGNTIYYKQWDANSIGKSSSSNDCFQIDINGQNKQTVDCKIIPNQYTNSLISNNLPSTLFGYSIDECIPNSQSPNWVACNFYNPKSNNNMTMWKIGLFNITQPKAGVSLVFDGNSPSW